MNTKALTFAECLSRFPNNDACKAFLEKKRWPDDVLKCPRCGSKAYRLAARPFYYLCKSGAETVDKQTGEVMICHKRNGYRFSVITGTIFEDTKIALNIWFKVGY